MIPSVLNNYFLCFFPSFLANLNFKISVFTMLNSSNIHIFV